MSATAFSISRQPISRIRLACALLVFIASLTVYTLTLAPTVTLIDSGELIVAASSLGVAHPPGFPLYVLLAHLATLVPVGNVAVRVNLASALFAALSASVLSLVIIEALMTVRTPRAVDRAKRRVNRKKTKKVGAPPAQTLNHPAPRSTFVLVVSCLMSGFLLAFSRTLWAYATIAEVYTLTALLILTVFLLMFRWRRGFIETTHRQNSASARVEEVQLGPDATAATVNRSLSSRPVSAPVTQRSLYAAAFIFGLALGVHHVSVGLMLPAMAVLVFSTAGIGFFRSKGLIYSALFALGGLILVYSYLPMSASRSPIMNWGDPRTLERLWWQITGRQYQVFFSYSLETAASQFGAFLKLVGREFGPWWLPAGAALALAGLVVAFFRDNAIFWCLALVIAADLLYALGYEIAEDKDAYYLPALIAMTIAAGFGAEWLLKTVTLASVGWGNRRSIVAVLVLLVPIAALVGNWSYNNRSRYFIAQDYVHNILSTVEQGGMLLTRDWQVYSPMLYFQEVEHLRKDAVVIDVNQLRRSWYFDYLRKAYPATMEHSAKQVEAFLEDLRQWEQDPDLYQRDLMLNQRINSRFFDMILVFVSNHVQTAPVYVALDIAGNREGQDAELTKSLAAKYEFIPRGLLFQLATQREPQPIGQPQLVTRGLADGTVEFADDDVVTQKVLPVYVNMLYNRGRYLALHGRHEQAIEVFRQSLALNPRFTLAQQAINESMTALRAGVPPGS